MICIKETKRKCKDDISKIENYDKAIADKTQTWDCHHRLELTLDGDFAHSVKDLKRLEMYYNRPYFELIFLTHDEHIKLHKSNKYWKNKSHNDNFGRRHTKEAKDKITKAVKGKTRTIFGEKFKAHYGITARDNINLYKKEYDWYNRHNYKCRWE